MCGAWECSARGARVFNKHAMKTDARACGQKRNSELSDDGLNGGGGDGRNMVGLCGEWCTSKCFGAVVGVQKDET